MGYETKAAAVVTAADAPAHAGVTANAELRGEIDALRLELKQDLDGLSRRLVSAPPAMAPGAGGRSTAFGDAYLRKGLDAGSESKRLSVGTGSEGGLAVPLEIDQRIETVLKQISPIRALADVVKIGSANYRKLVASGGFASGWVAETAARAETTTPTFAEVTAPMGELYANPAATQAMLDDAQFDVEAWLAREVAVEFARAEGVAFVSGTGTSQPKGFLTYPVATAGDASRPFGTLQYVPSGAAGAFAASNPQDRLIDLVHSLRAPYRQGAVWVMNSNSISTVRKFKDSTGDFIWKPGLAEGQSSTLLGYPVVEVDAMPDIGANSLSIGFGQFRSAYVIADRGETGVLRDPYSNKPFVHFYSTRRVGGALVNSEALKLMRFSAT
ncbi:phage major capsid protein [Sandaracinobacter sp.]|uniref:phage major capsid protein n=1 Tax=Sandaracinobacter sp. TaxID=2487581 RepID=UPI0035B06CF2